MTTLPCRQALRLGDAVRQLLENTAIILGLESLPFGDAIHVAPAASLASAISGRKTPGLIRQLVLITAVRVCQLDRLHKPEAGAAIRRVVYSVSFQAAAVGHDDE